MSRKELTTEQLEDAARLRELVSLSGMSQQQLADKLGMTQPGVYHFIAGTRALNIEVIIGFSAALRVPIEKISPSTRAKIDSAYKESPNLEGDIALLSQLDSAARADIERTVELLIRGAISKTQSD
jgi:transcriptional regulator with XRE-family HTH domain